MLAQVRTKWSRDLTTASGLDIIGQALSGKLIYTGNRDGGEQLRWWSDLRGVGDVLSLSLAFGINSNPEKFRC